MNKKQRLIVIVLGVADLVVLLLLGGTIIVSGLSGGQAGQLFTPTPVLTPTPTSIPTWTPKPTSTPYVLPTPTVRPTQTPRPLREDETAVLDQVEQEVVALRGLSPRRSVLRRIITRSRLRQLYADTFISDEWEEAAQSLAIVLSTFDFMAPHTDLVTIWQDSVSEGVLGFYVIETGEIYIVSSASTPGALERAIYAHEFDHALQDQHFDLEALGLDVTSGPEHGDRLLAVDALIEGDAGLLQDQHVASYFSEEDAWELLNELANLPSTSSSPAPRVLGELSAFPYVHGREFVDALYERGGWLGVDAAYADPPVSTEQILHPERYLAGDQPVPVSLSALTDTLGSDWRLIYEDTVGEFMLRLYLENSLDAGSAAAAAEGWGGDRCAVYYSDATGDTVTLLVVVWDTPADAEEFLDAYTVYADLRFHHTADEPSDEWACWHGDDILCVAWEEDNVTVVLGPDRPTVDAVLARSASE